MPDLSLFLPVYFPNNLKESCQVIKIKININSTCHFVFTGFLIFLCLFILPVYAQDEIELVESIPVGTSLDVAELRNTAEVWLEMINKAGKNI